MALTVFFVPYAKIMSVAGLYFYLYKMLEKYSAKSVACRVTGILFKLSF